MAPTAGTAPITGLVLGPDGNFYGTTNTGGTRNTGTAFRVSPNGTLRTLANFTGGAIGQNPQGVLVRGTDGKFYGTTNTGGPNGLGTAFSVTPDGVLTTLVAFNNTELEKIEIAKTFLAPKAIEGTGLTKDNITFTDEALQTVINRYTREAGVRNLEREISSICRKVARKVVAEGASFSEAITAEKVTQYLGVPRFRSTMAEEHNEIGIATGLAWTEVGGEILVTEATLMPGRGKLTLTGKLGDVMQESAQAAMSYVRTKSDEYGLPVDFNRKSDIHIHVPEGAIPKDGPSAGITLATALVSALSRVPVRKDVAMTGEITLRGKVLPIGGVKEKVLAAHRAGITSLILPKDNEKDLADIPKNVLDTLKVYMVQTMDEVLKIALTEPLTGRLPAEAQAEPVDTAVDDTITH